MPKTSALVRRCLLKGVTNTYLDSTLLPDPRMTIKKIYLPEAMENERFDYGFMNTDVIVQLDNEDKFVANFIAIKKLVEDIETDWKTKKNPSKKYYWSRNMVIVKSLKKKELLPMIEYMIDEGDFQLVFEKL